MLTWKPAHSPNSVQAVLIISNQSEVSEMWETLFQQKGCTTMRETHEKAIQTCTVIDPALIVIDSHLSHPERLVLCSKLRAITSEPILLLLSDCSGSQMIDLYNIGVAECLLKPISPAFLVIKAISWLLRWRWLEHDPELSPVYANL